MATFIIGIILAAVLFWAAKRLYENKKQGKHSCGGNCSCCPGGCAGKKE